MSRYNQYGNNYYDPVGSHATQPSGYSYQPSTSASTYPSAVTSAGYGSNYQTYGANTYSSQQHSTSANQQTKNSATHAAAALSSLSHQEYSQPSSANRTGSNNQYDNSSWFNSNTNSNVYGASNLALPNRSQDNNSPLHAQAPNSSTFGRISVPEQAQSSTNTYGSSQTYQNAPSTAAATSNRSYQTQPQSQPPRYSSPLHAAQAQQHSHNKQSSRSSNHASSPQTAQAVRSAQQNRWQSASVEPSPTTVDPSQVYDNRAELQRKAQIEAEKRRKYEAEQAAKRAEEERVAAEQKRKEEEETAKADEEAKKKAEQQRKNEQRKKAREEKKQSKSAASALQQMATGAARDSSVPENEEEKQMREMFQKMREFNSKNPALLAKLWDEERKAHESAKASPASASKVPAQQRAPSAASPTAAAAPAKPTPPKVASPAVQKAAKPAAPQQPRVPATQANTSLWPPHKKGAIAEATARWLASLPDNVGKSIHPEVVLNILNSNPAYVQLCEALEHLGMKFERSTLARELLKAVPDGLKAQPAAKPTTPLSAVSGMDAQVNGASSGSSDMSKKKGKQKKDEVGQRAPSLSAAAPGTVNYEAPLSLAEAAREINSMDRPSFQPMYGSPEHTQPSPYFTQSQTLPNGSRPPSQSQPPEVKQEDKPLEPPKPPADKEEAARKRTFADLVDLTAEDSEDEGPPPKKVMQPPSAPVNGANTQSDAFKQFMDHGPVQATQTSGQMQPPRPPTAQTAVPSYAPASQQLNGVQQQTKPQPPAVSQQQVLKSRGPSAEQLQHARMRGKMLVEPIMRDRVARKSKYDSRTIARDVLLATGRHPDMRGLNAHLTNMHKLLAAHGGETDSGGNRSDLSTIRWDIIDPEPSKEAKSSKPDAEASRPSLAPATRSTQNTAEYFPLGDQGIPIPKKPKRGRPPRSSMPSGTDYVSNPTTNGLGNPKASTPRPTTSRPATPSSAPTADMSGANAVGYSAFGQRQPDGAKKKGRPFGWRKNVHSREAQGLPKAAPFVPKGPGRPPKVSTPSKQQQEQVLQPHYQVYRCEWAGCKSELHNLDNLKKHLVKLHGRKNAGEGEDGEFVCLWEDCAVAKRQGGKVARFAEIEGWVDHVEKEHLQPLKWALGDGPRGGVVSGE